MSVNPKLDQTLDEIVIWAGASSINIYFGIILGVSSFIYYISKKYSNKINYKLIILLIIKLCVLFLYPLTILTLTKYKSYFLTELLFGLSPKPIDGFGAAMTIVLIHLLINVKLSKILEEVNE